MYTHIYMYVSLCVRERGKRKEKTGLTETITVICLVYDGSVSFDEQDGQRS